MITDVYAPLRAFFKARAPLTEAECEQMVSAFKVKKVKKKQLIIQPEFIAKHRYYVVQGALRSYVIDDDGTDHTIQAAIEDWWISDYNSYILQQPATMFVIALEDAVLLEIDFETEQALKQANYKFETIFRMMAERSAAFFQRRIISSLTQTAEERYNEFVQRYPLMVQRLPQYVVASYLGMSTEFLSKIRNNKVKKK